MKVIRTSDYSGETREMEIPITPEQLALYETGNRPIQEVFPELTESQREFIITGMTDDEWNQLCGDIEKACSLIMDTDARVGDLDKLKEKDNV